MRSQLWLSSRECDRDYGSVVENAIASRFSFPEQLSGNEKPYYA
ncbi:hypothetical protein [Coleofasciculus sp. H7-2]